MSESVWHKLRMIWAAFVVELRVITAGPTCNGMFPTHTPLTVWPHFMDLDGELMKSLIDDLLFLKELQHELNTQEHDGQASPRFWVVGDYKWVECSDDNAERFSVYLPNDGEAHEINYFLTEILDKDELSEEAIEEFEDIDCEISAFDWIQKHYDEGASLHSERKEHYVRQDTMFLTRAEAKRHIELNHYHYTKEAHTYAMTAWRAPKVERLLKLLSECDFDKILQQLNQEGEQHARETA